MTTREKILKAARKLFIEKGFSGTSMGMIAEQADINHSLIFHHFGNKEGLWKAVKLSIVAEHTRLSPLLPTTDQPFESFLDKLITQCITFYRDNPDIIRMLGWQRLEYKSKKAIGVTNTPEFKVWFDAFKHYQKKGDVNPALKTEYILTLIFSILSGAAMDPNVFIQKTSDLNKYIKFCLEGLLKLLR